MFFFPGVPSRDLHINRTESGELLLRSWGGEDGVTMFGLLWQNYRLSARDLMPLGAGGAFVLVALHKFTKSEITSLICDNKNCPGLCNYRTSNSV